MLPTGLLLGFALLLLLVLGDRLVPAREVILEKVVTLQSESETISALEPVSVDPSDAPLLFQASGWVEPDPLPIKATALVDGVVSEIHVLEGETVKKDQLLATLIDEDAKLNLRTAESRLRSLHAQSEAQAGQVAIIKAEMATLEQRIVAATAKKAELEDQVRRFDAAGLTGAVAEREVVLARLQLATQVAEIGTLTLGEEELIERLRQQTAIVREFEARVSEARTEVARQQLDLDRTRITSPLDGIILRLVAVPGDKRMLGMDHMDSSTIAILYQPDRLQARIDVPLAEAAKLAVGQAVRLHSSLLPDHVFHGQVTRIVGEADLQRNTIQAKVRIDNPDPRLRPEMLCRAEFLAPVTPAGRAVSESRRASTAVNLFVPNSALIGSRDHQATVWRLDESGERVIPTEVTLGDERGETHRLAIEGLRPGDRVVINPPADLQPGDKIRPKP